MIVIGIAIAVLLIIMAFLVYKNRKNRDLKSRNRKSAFASSYSEYNVSSAASSSPLKRNDPLPDRDQTYLHVHDPGTPLPVQPVNNPGSGVIEFYFEFEDGYRIERKNA